MKVFFFRFSIIATLFLIGAFLSGLTGQSYLALPVWYTAVVAWTLTLGFRKALVIVIPFLIVADVLWDAKIGAVLLVGFLLATATTYLSVRIETQSQGLQSFLYSILVGIFATLVIALALLYPDLLLTPSAVMLLLKIGAIELVTSALLYLPLSSYINWVEKWMDTSYQEQSKKIR
jgi:hypothetical protein